MTELTMSEALEWAKECLPKESCGVVIIRKGRERFIRCRNISPYNDSFVISPEDFADAEDQGEIVRIVHSHCYESPKPSEVDLVSCEQTNLPWSIVSVPNGSWHHFNPSGYVSPLVGREWCHGLLDCYSLIRDYYKQNLSIELPDFAREHEWWMKGENLYLENFKKAGFVEVKLSDLKEHDVLLMQIGSPVINHGGIYLGGERMLHHLHRRLSCRDILGGYYKKHLVKVVRYANG